MCRVAAAHERKQLDAAQTAELMRLAALRPADRFQALQRLLTRVLQSFKLGLLLQWGVHIANSLLKVGLPLTTSCAKPC